MNSLPNPAHDQQYQADWLEWNRNDVFKDHRDLIALAAHFEFRKNTNTQFQQTTISQFVKTSKPVKEGGYIRLYTMLGVLHYRGVIADKTQLDHYLHRWGMLHDDRSNWDEIWQQIEAGVAAYHTAIANGTHINAPPAKSTPVADSTNAYKVQQVAATPRRTLPWHMGVAAFSLLVISGLLLLLGTTRNDEALRLHAQQIYSERHSTQAAALGAAPTDATIPVPAQIFANATAGSATATAVVHIAAHPTITYHADDVPMVWVPPGCFWAGSYINPDSAPAFQMCLDGFWMDRYRVFNEQFRRVTGEFPNSRSCGDFSWGECANWPVESITWLEARDYCARRGAHLPTELQWEYAARGPLSYLYPWGNTFDDTQLDILGQRLAGLSAPQSVHDPRNNVSWSNVVGLIGGVKEWTRNWWGTYPYAIGETRIDDENEVVERVVRGVSRFDPSPTNGQHMTSFLRHSRPPTGRNYLIGFRCARNI